MTTYIFTLTGAFDASIEAEARLDYAEWLGMKGVAEHAVVTIAPSRDARIDRSDPIQAAAEDRYWLSAELDRLRQTLADHGIEANQPASEADHIWSLLSPQAKAGWVSSMMPAPDTDAWHCDECGQVCDTPTAPSNEHGGDCSLNPANIR